MDWYDADYCYECRGYGDDYSWDEEEQDFIDNCPTCPFRDKEVWGDDE